MNSKIILILFVSLFSLTTLAQKDSIKTQSPHHIGTAFDFTTGVGLSYRYWPGKFGIQITTAPMYFGDGIGLYNFGLSALIMIKDKEKADLYSYFGNSITIFKQSGDSNTIYTIGGGLGVKIDFLDDMNFNVNFGYGYFNAGANDHLFSITGGTSLYYNF